jgi:hypothetical protein
MAQQPIPNTEVDDSPPVTLDTIYDNLGGNEEPGQAVDSGGVIDNDGATVQSDGRPSSETKPDAASASPPTPAPSPSKPDDGTDIQRRFDQLTRTYIPAVERERDRAVQELQTVRSTTQGLQEYQQALTSHGLSPSEASIGLQIAAAYRADPAKTILSLIRNAQANGVQLPEGVPNPGVDTQSIQSIIKRELEPILAPLRERQQEAAQGDEIKQAISSFYAEFPDARIQEPVLAAYINAQGQQGRRISLHTAYIELYKIAATSGYDWTQPLAAQVTQRRSNPNPPPQPNLGSSRRTISPSTVNTPPEQYNPDMRWKDIVAAARAENAS